MAAKLVCLQNGVIIKEINMVWYLLFCSSVYHPVDVSNVCITPTVMPSKESCHFVGKQMVSMRSPHEKRQDPRWNLRTLGNYKCIGVKKVK